MNTTPVTVVGNLTDDPELRFTPQGVAVVSFTVAHNTRMQDKNTGEWKDGDPSFYRCQAWQQLAENVANSLRKGDRAIVAGTLRQQHWEDAKTGEKRSGWTLTADAVGAELRWATVQPAKMKRRDEVPPDDAWANATPAGAR